MHVFWDNIKNANITLKLLKVIHKLSDALDVGMSVNLRLSTYKKREKYKGSLFLDFHKGVTLLLSNITAHMIEECPLKYQIVRSASHLNPNTH